MLHSLIVALDGSEFAEQALPWAEHLAGKAGARLHLVRVHVSPWWGPDVDTPSYSEELERIIKEEETSYLQSVLERIGKSATLSYSLGKGGLADGIISEARQHGADLIVMTTHGRGPLSRFWLGSTADTVVRQALMPVLLIRPQIPSSARKEPGFHKVLIPLDGSALAEKALEPALVLGTLDQATCLLLQVIEPVSIPEEIVKGCTASEFEEDLLQRRRNNAQAYLQKTATLFSERGLRVETKVVVGKQCASSIIEEAERQKADLVALSTHGLHGYKRMRLGSIADKVLRGVSCPVLMVRPLE